MLKLTGEILTEFNSKFAINNCIYESVSSGRAVYNVYNSKTNMNYALKIFSLDHRVNDWTYITKEAKAFNKNLRRPEFFPKCQEFWQCFEKNNGYLLLDWMPGKTLSKFFTGKARDRRELIDRMRAFLAIAKVVSEFHKFSKTKIHRDLKPDNILIRKVKDHFHACLIDFGISDVERDTGEEGTPGWNAPEQHGYRFLNLTQKADIFSLGKIAWWLATGEKIDLEINGKDRPNTNWNASSLAPEQMLKILGFEIPKLEKAIFQALAFYPEKRYRNVGKMLSEIFHITKGR